MANYCRKCGQPLEEDYKVCPICGTKVYDEYQTNHAVNDMPDQYELLWGVLGFFFPLVGLILYLLWQEQKPLVAKYIGLGALIGFGSRVIFGFAGFTLFFPFRIFGLFF
ncbi:MAG: zinc-ribbon domain-containing protein [Candidatus Izemoplasmataceae bacterium]